MNVADMAVLAAAVLSIGGSGWFFFGPRKASTAQLAGGVQRVTVRVAGGYSPDLVRVRQGGGGLPQGRGRDPHHLVGDAGRLRRGDGKSHRREDINVVALGNWAFHTVPVQRGER